MLIDGVGDLTYPDGGRYEGNWFEGYRHGKGNHYYANGDRYVGVWGSGLPNGSGSYSTNTGIVYGGAWKCGRVCTSLYFYIFYLLIVFVFLASWIWLSCYAKWKTI